MIGLAGTIQLGKEPTISEWRIRAGGRTRIVCRALMGNMLLSLLSFQLTARIDWTAFG